MEDEELTTQEFKAFLQHVVQDLQSSQAEEDGVNPDVLAVILQNTGFFHKNLEQPANLHDFVQLAKLRLNYEVHQYGSVLMREADYSDKLCIILKGSVQKYQQRAYDDLEAELRKKNPKAYKQALLEAQLSDAKETSTKEKPRYLQHTKSTYKKAALGNLPGLNNFAKTLDKLPTEADQEDQEANDPTMKVVTFAGSKTLNNIDDDDNKSDHSLNDQEWDHEEGAPQEPPTKSMILRRLTIKPPSLHKKAYSFKRGTSQSQISNVDAGSQEEEAPIADMVIEVKKKKERKTEGGGAPKTEGESSLNETDLEVLKHVIKYYPELKGRFFIANIARVKKQRTYKTGDYFGETFYKENRAKEHAITVVNSEELHLLTFGRESYQAIMDELIVNAREKAYFFTDLFPSFEAETVKKFSYHFSEKSFKKNETIYAQNDEAKHIYLLRFGDVKLLKEIEFTPPHGTHKHAEKVELPITNIMKQQFFGEEFLLKEAKRHQTAIALTSGTVAYFLGGREYNNIKGNYEDLLTVLKQQSKEKLRWRQQRAMDLLEQKRQNAERAPPMASLKLIEKYKSISDPNIPVLNDYPAKKSDFSKISTSRVKLELPLQSDYSSRIEAPAAGFTLKDHRVVMMGSLTAKNMELYKNKFSRRTNMVDKANIEERFFKKKEEAKAQNDIDSQVKGGLIRFNIRRELSEKKIRVKLPSLTPKASTKLHRVGSETSRGTIGKYAERFAAMYSPHGDSSQPKSTVLDDIEPQPHHGGLTPIKGVKKGRFAELMHSAEIPSGVYNIIKRVSDNKTGMFSPSSNQYPGHAGTLEDLKRDEIKGMDDYMIASTHIKKAPKRMAGGFTNVRRKVSEDGKNTPNGQSFSIVAKKKEIL